MRQVRRERKYTHMIKLLIGVKGTGKTKTLIESVNKALDESKGYVVCLEKGTALRSSINYKVRLINTDDYCINDASALSGMIAGIIAGNSDVTDIFVDGTLKICGNDLAVIENLLGELETITKDNTVKIVLTVSIATDDATDTIKKYL